MMDSNWNNRSGAYLGEAPQRGGFGRKAASLATSPPESFTLSKGAQSQLETHQAHSNLENDIDFKIGGTDMQYVEIELDPRESVIAEPGAMIWKDCAVTFDTCLGDGSEANAGLGRKLASAGMNLLAGERMFLAEFRHDGLQGKARLAFGGRSPGHIIPVRLEAMGGSLICHRRSFLAAAKGIKVTISMQRKLSSAIFGSEGFIMQRLTGRGWAFLHVGGTIIERDLQAGEIIHVDGGCVAAHEPTVSMEIDDDPVSLRRIKSAIVGGESLFLTALRGPGKIWLQTLPFSRLAAETAAQMPEQRGNSGSTISQGADLIDGLNSIRKLF